MPYIRPHLFWKVCGHAPRITQSLVMENSEEHHFRTRPWINVKQCKVFGKITVLIEAEQRNNILPEKINFGYNIATNCTWGQKLLLGAPQSKPNSDTQIHVGRVLFGNSRMQEFCWFSGPPQFLPSPFTCDHLACLLEISVQKCNWSK